MPLSVQVTLRRLQRPHFPDLCVVCLADQPDSGITLREQVFGWQRFFAGLITSWTLFFPGKKVGVTVPACEECRRLFVRSRRLWSAAQFVWVAATISATLYWYGDVIRPFGKLGMAAVAILTLIPPALISIFTPPAVELTVNKMSTEYEFRSPDYAQEFAELNGARVQ